MDESESHTGGAATATPAIVGPDQALDGWQVQQLVLEFYASLDEKRYDDLIGLFTSDGVWNRLGKPLVGPDAIREALATREDWLTAHVVSNIRVELLDADHARSAQYVTLYRIEGVEPGSGPGPIVPPMGILSHRDQHVRVDGVWKIASKSSRAMLVNRARVTHYDKPADAEVALASQEILNDHAI